VTRADGSVSLRDAPGAVGGSAETRSRRSAGNRLESVASIACARGRLTQTLAASRCARLQTCQREKHQPSMRDEAARIGAEHTRSATGCRPRDRSGRVDTELLVTAGELGSAFEPERSTLRAIRR
jgi:hypothetical protein